MKYTTLESFTLHKRNKVTSTMLISKVREGRRITAIVKVIFKGYIS